MPLDIITSEGIRPEVGGRTILFYSKPPITVFVTM